MRSNYLLTEEDRALLGDDGQWRTITTTEWEPQLRDATEAIADGVFNWEDSLLVLSTGNWWEKALSSGNVRLTSFIALP
jgi:hypothetical protein